MVVIQIEVSGDGRSLIVRRLVGYVREPTDTNVYQARALYETQDDSDVQVVGGLPVMMAVEPGGEAPVWRRVSIEEVEAWLEEREER